MLESFSGVWRKRPCGDGDNGFEVLGFGFWVLGLWVLRCRRDPGVTCVRKTQNAKPKTQNLNARQE